MNKFFYQLKLFITRLHIVIFIIWILSEIFGNANNIPMLVSIFSEELTESNDYSIGFALIGGFFLLSYSLFAYLLSSFIDEEELLLDNLKIKKANEMVEHHNELAKIEEEKEKKLRVFLYRATIFIVVVILIMIVSNLISPKNY